MIKFENVTKSYKEGARPALNSLSVNIERGEFVFLVGSSGSGKSTFLSLVLRAERANSGQILVAGRNLDTLTNWRVPAYRQQIGVVFQNFRLLRNKTVYENVAFALKVIGKPRRTIQSLVPEALKIVGLEDKADRMPDQLSGGEQQRVAIARAFVNRPLIILADEPTGNLDPATSGEIMQVFEMISKMGTTIVMATHSEEIVNSMQKRVIELHHGKLIRDEANARYISRLDNTPLEEVSAIGEDQVSPIDKPVVTPNSTPPPVDSNQTVRIPKMSRLVPDNNSTAPIPNLSTLDTANEFVLADPKQDADTALYDNYFHDTGDLFDTGAFDAGQFRPSQTGPVETSTAQTSQAQTSPVQAQTQTQPESQDQAQTQGEAK